VTSCTVAYLGHTLGVRLRTTLLLPDTAQESRELGSVGFNGNPLPTSGCSCPAELVVSQPTPVGIQALVFPPSWIRRVTFDEPKSKKSDASSFLAGRQTFIEEALQSMANTR
jgi:hypothetical protein